MIPITPKLDKIIEAKHCFYRSLLQRRIGVRNTARKLYIEKVETQLSKKSSLTPNNSHNLKEKKAHQNH